MPVFLPQRVLDEAAALTRAERGRETGGVLIGNLRHDPAVPDIFAEVTAQISAEHTRGDAVKAHLHRRNVGRRGRGHQAAQTF